MLNKSCNLYNFTEEAIRDPRVNRLTSITRLVEVAEGQRMMSMEVRVKMKNGREFSEVGSMRRDWMEKPTSKEEILAKFWHQVEFSKTVSQKDAEKLVQLVDNLEEVDNVNTLVEVMLKWK